MRADYTIRQGDTQPVFAQTLSYADNTPVNLTGATIDLIIRSLSAATPLLKTGVVTSPDRPNGKVQYRPSIQDTATPGPYLANWQITFADGTPMSFPTIGFLWVMIEEALIDAQISAGIRPSVTDVASILRARTKVRGGSEIGTFNTLTRPTAPEVESLIDDAVSEILGKVQPIDPTLPPGSAFNAPGSKYEQRIRNAVKLYAALLIELSYFPEQIRTGQSATTTLQTLYDSRIRALIAEGEHGIAEGMGEGAGGAGDAPADAAWSFPADTGGLVGWQSRF